MSHAHKQCCIADSCAGMNALDILYEDEINTEDPASLSGASLCEFPNLFHTNFTTGCFNSNLLCRYFFCQHVFNLGSGGQQCKIRPRRSHARTISAGACKIFLQHSVPIDISLQGVS